MKYATKFDDIHQLRIFYSSMLEHVIDLLHTLIFHHAATAQALEQIQDQRTLFFIIRVTAPLKVASIASTIVVRPIGAAASFWNFVASKSNDLMAHGEYRGTYLPGQVQRAQRCALRHVHSVFDGRRGQICRTKNELNKSLELFRLSDRNINVDDEVGKVKDVSYSLTVVVLFLIFVQLDQLIRNSFVFIQIRTLMISCNALRESISPLTLGGIYGNLEKEFAVDTAQKIYFLLAFELMNYVSTLFAMTSGLWVFTPSLRNLIDNKRRADRFVARDFSEAIPKIDIALESFLAWLVEEFDIAIVDVSEEASDLYWNNLVSESFQQRLQWKDRFAKVNTYWCN